MSKKVFIAIIIIAALALSACGAEQAPLEAISSPLPAQETAEAVLETTVPENDEPTGSAISAIAPVEPQATAAQAYSSLYQAIPLPEEMRAMWISFLEWNDSDIASEEAMRNLIINMFDNCLSMGLNTVIVAVRPFSDAFYQSAYYPWSHLIGGAQGQDPGYDPLTLIAEEAHARGLRVEAWLNPYRVSHPSFGPDELSADNPAALNPEWLREQSGRWLDPGIPEVRSLIVNGVVEIVSNYNVDGIHFDDYFYPEGNTEAFDDATFQQYGGGLDRADWRRQNVNEMVSSVYAAVKAANPSVSFGVSPQGNNENNYNEQYCDINMWMEQPGYADYIMPQLYWGFNYTRNGDDRASYHNKTAEWASYSRGEHVKLYAGLGAYRIGEGDGSDDSQGEWQNGHNLADMVSYLRTVPGFSGFALFRYANLYPLQDGAAYADLSASEAAALTAAIGA